MSKKRLIFERSGEARRWPGGIGRRPHNSLRERLGPFAEVTSRRLRQAKAWRGVSKGLRPLPPAPYLGLVASYWLLFAGGCSGWLTGRLAG